MNRFVRSAAVGALAGAGATIPMTAFMFVTKAAGELGELPPRQIVRMSLRRLGIKASKPTLAASTVGVHFAVGAALGVAMALLREARFTARTKRSAMKVASTVWAGAYRGTPRARFLPMMAAHWIYGIAFDEIFERI
jgi:hypothetical protein